MLIKIGQMLIKKGLITPEQLEAGIEQQRKTGQLLGAILIKNNFLSEEDFLKTFSEQLGIPYVRLKDFSIDLTAIKSIPAKFAWHYKVIPLKFENDKLVVATSYPLKLFDDLRLFLGHDIKPLLALKKEVEEAINEYYGIGAETVEGILAKSSTQLKDLEVSKASAKIDDIEKLAEDASVVKLVNQILLEAYQKRATDIHIEPFQDKMNIRYRIDGVLYNANVPENIEYFYPAITSRIKIMSKLNIVERRLPQDGRAIVKIGEEKLDLRISIIPTRYGEGVVIRILPSNMLLSLEKLGLNTEDLKTLKKVIKKPHGIILVTGPTGSGKTTTLYTCLNEIKSTENKIITIEDPVEYEMEDISQIQILPEIGFTFAQGLRNILRHDPDIIMVGEIRDFETAELAIRSALTGHLIFSTLHTNDAAGGTVRLMNMGIESYLITSSVEAFIAQRLVRLICQQCKEQDANIPADIREMIFNDMSKNNMPLPAGITKEGIRFYRGKGCKACNFTGFKGRNAIYEILIVDKNIRELILKKAPPEAIRDSAIASGMKTLRLAGWQKVIEGVTTPEEVMRVTQALD